MDPERDRGRDAAHPTELTPLAWKDIAVRVARSLIADRISLISAGVAFFGLLAIFPGIAFCMAVAGLITDPATIVAQMDAASHLLPHDVAKILVDQAREVAGAEGGKLGVTAVIGLVIALYSASRGTDSIVEGLNVAYNETEKRGVLKRFALVLFLTVCLVLGTVTALLLTAVLPALLRVFGTGTTMETIIDLSRWPILLLCVVLGLSLLYRIGPSRRKAKWRWLSPGATFACVLWLAASYGFSFYVENFGSYNETFGAIAGVVILLLWLWISAFIVLLGAEVDGEMEAQTRKDTTVGPDRPMGQRGAYKADHLGKATG